MNEITVGQWAFLNNEDKDVMLKKWKVASSKKTTRKKTTGKRKMSAAAKKAFVARMAKARAEKRK